MTGAGPSDSDSGSDDSSSGAQTTRAIAATATAETIQMFENPLTAASSDAQTTDSTAAFSEVAA